MILKQTAIIFIAMFMGLLVCGCQENSVVTPTEPVAQTESSQTPEPVTQEQTPPQPEEAATPAKEVSQAEKKLVFAESSFNMAQKGVVGYSQCVAICRSIIEEAPGTEVAEKAQAILREIPADQRDRYKLTNEELGL